jgi:hypothetical protein
VVTNGIYDQRPLVAHYGLPDDLRGRRAIDVGTADGFWAVERERRGADVTALDIGLLFDVDLPPALRSPLLDSGSDRPFGSHFAEARRRLGPSVRLRQGASTSWTRP